MRRQEGLAALARHAVLPARICKLGAIGRPEPVQDARWQACDMTMAPPAAFKYVSKKRRVREDRRFVAGKATFVGDVTPPGTLHAAVLTSPYACARIAAIDAAAALAMPGVHLVVGGRGAGGGHRPAADRRRCAAGEALPAGRRARALFGRVGRRGGGRQPRAGRGRVRGDRRRVRAAAVPARRRGRLRAGQRPRASRPRLQRAARQALRVGRRGRGVRRCAAQARLSRQMGPQRHRADRDLRRGGELGPLARAARRVGLHPDAEVRRPDRPRAAHAAQRRARAPGRGRRRQLRRQARHQAHGARGLPLAPAVAPREADRGPAREHARRRHARAGAHLRRGAGVRRQPG